MEVLRNVVACPNQRPSDSIDSSRPTFATVGPGKRETNRRVSRPRCVREVTHADGPDFAIPMVGGTKRDGERDLTPQRPLPECPTSADLGGSHRDRNHVAIEIA